MEHGTIKIKTKIFFLSIIFFGVFGVAGNSMGATINAASCNQSDVQSAVNSAIDGDIINIPAGACNWGDNYVSWAEKNISVFGAGIDKTVISVSGIAFDVADEIKASFRISGMTINGLPKWGYYIRISSRYQTVAKAVYGWRIDHIKFDHGSSSGDASVMVNGVNWGVIDHCDFENLLSGPYELFHIEIDTSYYNAEKPYKSSYDWSLPIDWGTEKAIYIEDNIFNAPNVSGAGHPFDTATGGRVVFRHNTVTGGGPLFHPSNIGQIGVIKYEVYNNSFFAGSYTGYFPFTVQGGGTGIVFENQWSGWNSDWAKLNLMEWRVSVGSNPPLGACNGSSPVDGNLEPSGWPCFAQVGRGPGGVSSPVYAWKNGTEAGCAMGGACTNTVNLISSGTGIENYIKSTPHINGEVDFINNGSTPKSGYTPYIYPHPLQGIADATSPAAPQGLVVK